MPKKEMDYSKCLIYKIVCNDLSVTDCYVGHTTNFKQRKNRHRTDCNNKENKKYNFKLYQTMRDNGGRDNWTIVEIEKYPCKDIYEATARERYWYETLNANLNVNVPNRSHEEYHETYKEHLKEKKKEYNEANKEHFKKIQKEWNEKNKEYITNYNHNRVKEEVTCECGIKCCKTSLKKHQSRQIHIDNLASKV